MSIRARTEGGRLNHIFVREPLEVWHATETYCGQKLVVKSQRSIAGQRLYVQGRVECKKCNAAFTKRSDESSK